MISLDSRTKKPKLWSLLALSLAMIPVLLILYRTGTAGGTQEIQLCTVRAASVLLCLYYMAALFLLGNAFRKQLEYNPYSYNVIYYSGFFFFTFFILEILLFLMLSSFTEADRLGTWDALMTTLLYSARTFVILSMPILMTFRTSKEGGEKAIEDEVYADINIRAAQTGYVDLVDVEVFTGDEIVKKIIDGAHAAGVKVVASNHDFFKTPDKDDIVGRLRKMQDLGADIPKIAVMPQNKKDVLTLLAATEEMANEYADRPIITMSMAGTGVISRLAGEVFGSALTFGAAAKASAPGQMGVTDLKQILTLLHGAL